MEKETSRIEAFSDGVFAIAVTLLVLELHVPALKEGDAAGRLLEAMTAQWPGYLSFVISFFSIFIMWVNHHKMFKQIYRRNSGVMYANGLILFLTSLVSYPSALLARFYDSASQQTVVSIYTGMFVLVNLAFILLWREASSDRTLLRPGLGEKEIIAIRNNNLYGLPAYLAAFGLSFYVPAASLCICILLWIFWAFSSKKLDFKEHHESAPVA